MQDKINILNELKDAGASVLINAGNKNYYAVPEGYFNNLPNDILLHVFVKSLPLTNVYTVPEKYFENLPQFILEKIHIPLLTNKQNLYSVPDGYFNTFSDNILKKIKSSEVQQELEEISPFLSKIEKRNVYSVPENYFSEISFQKTTNVGDSKPVAKIISLGNRTRTWLKYAVAACVTAILFGGGYLYFSNGKQDNVAISSLSTMDVQKEISGLSDDEITNYLKDNNNMAVYTSSEPDDSQLPGTDIQNLLQNVSDEEIQQYLNNDPQSPKSGKGI